MQSTMILISGQGKLQIHLFKNQTLHTLSLTYPQIGIQGQCHSRINSICTNWTAIYTVNDTICRYLNWALSILSQTCCCSHFQSLSQFLPKKITCQNLLYLTKETGDTVLLYSSNYIFVDFVVSQIQINMISILPF